VVSSRCSSDLVNLSDNDIIIRKDFPELYSNKQVSRLLKTGIPRYIQLNKNAIYCYMDNDVAVISKECSNIFERFISPVTFVSGAHLRQSGKWHTWKHTYIRKSVNVTETILKDFPKITIDDNYVIKSSGVFLFNHRSCSFFKAWQRNLLKIFANPEARVADEGALNITLHQSGLQNTISLSREIYNNDIIRRKSLIDRFANNDLFVNKKQICFIHFSWHNTYHHMSKLLELISKKDIITINTAHLQIKRPFGCQNPNTPEIFNEVYKKIGRREKRRRILSYKAVLEWITENSISLLDIGCGTGYGLEYIQDQKPNAALSGCDYSGYAIQKATEQYPNIIFFEHDISKDELIRSYDYILLLETLEHLDDPISVIEKLLKHCKYLIISVPYKENNNYNLHVYQNFTKDSFKLFNIIDYKVLFKKVTKVTEDSDKDKCSLYIKLKGKIEK